MTADQSDIADCAILADLHRKEDGTFDMLVARLLRIAGGLFRDDEALHDPLRYSYSFGQRVRGRLFTEMYLTCDRLHRRRARRAIADYACWLEIFGKAEVDLDSSFDFYGLSVSLVGTIPPLLDGLDCGWSEDRMAADQFNVANFS